MAFRNPMAPLRRLIDHSLTAVDVVPGPLYTVDPGMDVADARKQLSEQNFDVAGVDGVGGEPIATYVSLERLRGATGGVVSDVAIAIPASRCIEKGLSLGRLVESLRDEESMFMLDGDRVGWLVTRADLRAPAFGAAILSYLVVIEEGLRILVCRFTDGDWIEELTTERRNGVEERFDHLRKSNLEISRDLCANFSDWLHVASKTVDTRQCLGYSSGSKWDRATAHFQQDRNDLAHGRTLFDGRSFEDGIDRIAAIRDFADVVWAKVDALDSTETTES